SNDIAILVDDRLIVLVEHQSTINENMPLRLLEYVSRIYEQIVPSEDRYEKKMIKIPYPEFYVFYNGTDEYPVENELRLSDAFILPEDKYASDKKISLEILVKVININIDKENPILKQCRALQEYSTLIELIRETKRQNPNAPLEEALSKAINDGILEDYLKRKSTEVRNMLIAEYSYETDIKVQRREAFRLGKEEGAEEKAIEAAKKFIKMGLPIDQISEGIGLSKEEVQKLAEENNK
ncbi:MAG: Rpn family recombination-promoting nuclease/putative transposase, partial [Treponema sp.]|nr:Rpn family recombination-promoting nuclease/putative transposase [Treponema sp.]